MITLYLFKLLFLTSCTLLTRFKQIEWLKTDELNPEQTLMEFRLTVIYPPSFKRLQNVSPNKTDSFEIPKSAAVVQAAEAVFGHGDQAMDQVEQVASVPTGGRFPNRISGSEDSRARLSVSTPQPQALDPTHLTKFPGELRLPGHLAFAPGPQHQA